MQMRKTVHFQTFCKKLNVICLPISITLRVIPIKFETLKSPSVRGDAESFRCSQRTKRLDFAISAPLVKAFLLISLDSTSLSLFLFYIL
jgi:hypothetical protein